jgi:hypothetical protein
VGVWKFDQRMACNGTGYPRDREATSW